MSIKKNLTGSGLAGQAATKITGSVTTGLTAAGSSSQANALAVYDDVNVITTAAANSGVRLRSDITAGDTQVVVNYGASQINVYPPVGGKISNGSVNAATTLPANASAQFICVNTLDFAMIKSV